MFTKVSVCVVLLAVGCFATPLESKNDDVSKFFEMAQPESRIVGGVEAEEGSVPYMVALSSGYFIRSFLCGASLVTSRHVLTAAHCLDGLYLFGSLIGGLRGTVGTNRWNTGGTSFTFSHNVSHPNWVTSTIKNDLAVLFTSTNVLFTDNISQVTLDFNPVLTGTATRVHGFGRVVAGGSLATTLMQLDNAVIDNQFCHEEVQRFAVMMNTVAPPVEGHIEVCTFHSVGQGTCNGDSGSALIRRSNGAQIGIVSWGFPCALGAPDMFTRLENYRDWLLGVLV